eukprot:SAG31_NODE_21951_length_537_cov_0.947489_1_plen_125_part_01
MLLTTCACWHAHANMPCGCSDAYALTRENLQLEPGPDDTKQIRSKVNGACLQAGAFTTPSVAELRMEFAKLHAAVGSQGGREGGGAPGVTVRHLVCNDVLYMHAQHPGALFQVCRSPSFSNCLQM